MNPVDKNLQPEQLRADLFKFWNEALAIEPIRNGIAVAMPQTGFDGWQLVMEITEATPGTVKISDAGRTLGSLASLGQNVEASTLTSHLDAILRQSHMERNGMELFRWLPLPIDPVEIHVFAEAMSAVSHLHVLNEPTVRSQDLADLTLHKIFDERKIKARPNATLSGKTEKNLRVDYLTEETIRPVAFEILRRRGRVLPVMEQWGYRWHDIKQVNPALMPVMLYDPASVEIDEASQAIGEDVCSLFCAYNETDRIHSILESASKPA